MGKHPPGKRVPPGQTLPKANHGVLYRIYLGYNFECQSG